MALILEFAMDTDLLKLRSQNSATSHFEKGNE